MPTRQPADASKRSQQTPAAESPATDDSAPGTASTPEPQRQDQTGASETMREVSDAIRNLSQETATLIRQEIQLAKEELTEKGKKAGLGGGMFGAAGVLALFAGGAFTAFLILALSTLVGSRRAALIVTALFGATAGALAASGRKKLEEATPLVPDQAIETAKKTKGRVEAALQASFRQSP